MKVRVTVSPDASGHEFALVAIQCGAGERTTLDIDYTTVLDTLPRVNETALDMFYIAAVVYAVDKLIDRRGATDGWTRSIDLEVPVGRPQVWRRVRESFADVLSFLTGDRWSVSFVARTDALDRPEKNRDPSLLRDTPSAVCLFSGGMDSLAGAIDWLEAHPSESLVLAGHHDPRVPGPLGDQERVCEHLRPAYGSRLIPLLVRVGQFPPGGETSFRSRSLLFIGLGVLAASAYGEIPIVIPENGTIALNVPLTPSRRGSCSTRTAHPYYLKSLQRVLTELGLEHSLHNPFEMFTKGEVGEHCANRTLFRTAVKESVSCAKRGHTSTWVNRSARECGRCLPCIYRRAALHRIGLDDEIYGVDLCAGEVAIESSELSSPDDLRACLSFLRRNSPVHEIAKELVANGPFDQARLGDYAEVVARAMDEIREFLKAKSSSEIQALAGILE